MIRRGAIHTRTPHGTRGYRVTTSHTYLEPLKTNPWNTKGYKVPVHLDGKYSMEGFEATGKFLHTFTKQKSAEIEPVEQMPMTIYQIWRYLEIERISLIERAERNKNDHQLIAYIKDMYPDPKDQEFLLNCKDMLPSVVLPENIIRVPLNIIDGYQYADYVKLQLALRNNMNRRTFRRLNFFELVHLRSVRFPTSKNKIEINNSFGDYLPCTRVDWKNPDNDAWYRIAVILKLDTGRLELHESEKYGYASMKMWEGYVGYPGKELTEMITDWLEHRMKLPIWHNHVLVVDEY